MRLSVSMVGHPLEAISVLEDWPELHDANYDELDVDDNPVGAVPWEEAFREAKQDAGAIWYEKRNGEPTWRVWKRVAYSRRRELLSFAFNRHWETLEALIAQLETLPFKVAVMGNIYVKDNFEIADAWNPQHVDRWSFARAMIDHGWGCAFRGAGHDHLVSRRWLDFGPWRVIRRPNDTTFIQFHDLTITDPAEAYAQAAPGHQRMGIDVIGGYFLPLDEEDVTFVNEHVQGFYLPDDKKLEIVVAPGVGIAQEESMRWACGLRLHHRLTQPTSGRIDTIAYIFIDEGEARAHLHELWLRELECWYISPTGKHRLDADYHPVPNPPEWVKRLDSK